VYECFLLRVGMQGLRVSAVQLALLLGYSAAAFNSQWRFLCNKQVLHGACREGGMEESPGKLQACAKFCRQLPYLALRAIHGSTTLCSGAIAVTCLFRHAVLSVCRCVM
jgi:hypothetical protein